MFSQSEQLLKGTVSQPDPVSKTTDSEMLFEPMNIFPTNVTPKESYRLTTIYCYTIADIR